MFSQNTKIANFLIYDSIIKLKMSSRTPRPVVVEPMEQFDDEDGLPEKLMQKTQQYHK